jgi:short-subunit dehydrogenase
MQMKHLAGKTALVTGASGGLGIHICRALALEGMNLALVAFPGDGLEELQIELEALGVRAMHTSADLRDSAAIAEVYSFCAANFGSIDVLVNNAGIEFTSFYHELEEDAIRSILRLNLEAPLLLSRLVIPDMLKAGRGRIINISSLAGKSGPACQETYAASKAGLIAFTSSLRASYRDRGVSASVLCPGFVEAGIYLKLKQTTGCAAPFLLGTSQPEKVAKGLIQCLKHDLPELLINPLPIRPLLLLNTLFPRLGAWATARTGAHAFFKKVSASQKSRGITWNTQQGSNLKSVT